MSGRDLPSGLATVGNTASARHRRAPSLSLAKGWGGQLVTLDRGIPGAVLIPKQPDGPMMIRETTVPYCVGTQYASRLN
jgi:hypothetical protein